MFFSHYLLNVSRIDFSEEFLVFELAWRRDEWNHTVALATIYSLLYGVSQQELFEELAERKNQADFEPIAHLLTDEFSILVLMAYDEIRSTKAYIEDQKYFQKFNDPEFSIILRKLARDEAYHFKNCIRLLKLEHTHNLERLPKTLSLILEYALNDSSSYKGTFILDQSAYTSNMEQALAAVRVIQRYFNIE